MRNRTLARFTGLVLLCAIVVAARLRVSHVARTLAVPHPVHVGLHCALFALLAMLAVFAVSSWRSRTVLFAGVLLFAYATEFYEHTRDMYPVEAPDVAMDGVGASIGLATAAGLAAATRQSRRRRTEQVHTTNS